MIKPEGGNLSKANARLLMQLMAGALEYQGREWDVPITYTEHPFKVGCSALWCGAPGVTDSIGVWFDQIRERLLELDDEVDVEFRLYYVEVSPGHKDYIADIWFEDYGEHLMVSGINNYSGTGGAGGKLLPQVVDALADFLEPKFERRGFFQKTQAQFEEAFRKHSDAIMNERALNENYG